MLVASMLVAASTAAADRGESAVAIAADIDAALGKAWAADEVVPAERCGDGEYLRRICLDVIGRIPTAAEAREFVTDPTPSDQKRRRLAAELFGRPTHLIHQTNIWRGILIPEASSDIQSRQLVPEFEEWLRRRLLAGRRYDDLVRELLTVPRLEMSVEAGDARPSAFFEIRNDEPERLAASTTRAFLGVRLECAQCHDHPFDDWKQDQFWQLAAFFAQPTEFDDQGRPLPSIAVPETERTVAAVFPDGGEPDASFDPRQPLAEWITGRDNAYFSRAIANRLWAQFFGAGLVEPVDDFSPYNPAHYPDVLDAVAKAVRDSDFDLDLVAHSLTQTKLYGLSSATSDPSHHDAAAFGRMPVRALSPEQLYDSLSQATGRLRVFDPSQPVNFNGDEARSRFLEQFARESVAARDQASSILQALMMMNGDYVSSAVDLSESRTLAAVAGAPFLSTDDRVDALYLAAYARLPTRQERDLASTAVGASASERDGLADLFWAMLNSSEFLFNH